MEEKYAKIVSIGFCNDVAIGGSPVLRIGKGYDNVTVETTVDSHGDLSGVDLVRDGKSVWVPISNIAWVVFE